jgi:hypothetical protein
MDVKDNTDMAIWIQSETTMVKNTKFLRLSRTLNIGIAETIGLLTLLWHCVLEMKEDGDITSWNNDDIECYAHWQGKRGAFAKALFIEEHQFIDKADGKNLIHDWTETAGRYLIRRYGTANRNRLVEIWAMYGKTYGVESSDEPSPKPKNQKPAKVFSDDSIEIKISKYLFDQIQKNDTKAKKPDFQKWAVYIDKLMRIDGRTKEEIGKVLQWIQVYKGTNGFTWKSNILSTKKLHEKFTALWTQMKADDGKSTGKAKGKYAFQEGKYPTLNQSNVRQGDSRT